MGNGRRAWRRGKTQAMLVALRAIAALEGITLPAKNDVGMLRHRLCASMSPIGAITTVNRALTRAAVEYEKQNPEPKGA